MSAVAVRHLRANGVDGRCRVDAASPRRPFGDDHQVLAARLDGTVNAATYPRRTLGDASADGGLDVVRVVLTAVDHDLIRDAPGDVQLAVEVEPQIARP